MSGRSLPIVFAFDAGATSTRAVVVNSECEVMWYGEGEGASVSRSGPTHAAVTIMELWQRAIDEAGEENLGNLPAVIAGGFAGARTGSKQNEITAILNRLTGGGENHNKLTITITHDAAIALVGAAGVSGPASILISGTGSICMVRDQEGNTALAGGWGWPLGDEGSATWVGWRTVQIGLMALEDGTPSELTNLVLRVWKLNEGASGHDVMLSAITAGKDSSMFAALAPGVHELAIAGNPDALALVSETGEVLGRLIEKACRRVTMTPGIRLPAVFMGSLAQAWRDQLCDPVRLGAGPFGDNLEITDSLLPAHGGAALLGLTSIGISPGDEGIERLRKGFD